MPNPPFPEQRAEARIALDMLKRGQVLSADHPLVVLEDALDRAEFERAELARQLDWHTQRLAESTQGYEELAREVERDG